MPSALTDAQLQQLERAFLDAVVGDDVETLDGLLSENLQYIHSSALSESKREYLKGIRERSGVSKKMKTVYATRRCYEEVGIVSHILHATVVQAQGESVNRQRVVHVWVEEPKGWRLVYRQGTRLPEDMQ
jgi:hypothetical protein